MALYKCTTCGDTRGSYHDQPKCNHGQLEDGFPIPITDMILDKPGDSKPEDEGYCANCGGPAHGKSAKRKIK